MKVTDGPKNKGGARAPQPPQKRFPTLSIATKLPAAVNMDKSCVSYINAYSLIAETTRVPKSQFYGNEEKTYELTHAALNILKAKSDTSLEAWDRHEVVDGFRELVEKEFGFAAVHSWMDKKEAQFSKLMGVYAELGLSPETPHAEVRAECELRIGGTWEGGASKALKEFYALIEDSEVQSGRDAITKRKYGTWGELSRVMFDRWLQLKLVSENLAAKLEEVKLQVQSLETQRQLQVKAIEDGTIRLEAEQATSKRLRGEKRGLSSRLDGVRDELDAKKEELDQTREILRAVRKEADRVPHMENTISQLRAQLEGKEAPRLSEEDMRGETIAPPEPPVMGITAPLSAPDKEEAGEAAAEADVVAELDGEIAAAFDEAAKPVDSTERIELEELEEVREIGAWTRAKEKMVDWNPTTKFGRAVKSIGVYGILGLGEKMEYPKAPPEEQYLLRGEDEAAQAAWNKHDAAIFEYKETYNAVARWIRNKRRKVAYVAAGALAVGALALGGITVNNAMDTGGSRAKEAFSQLPTPAQVVSMEEDTGEAVQVETGGEVAPEVKKVEPPKPKAPEKPVLEKVLAEHGLSLEGINLVRYYPELEKVTDTAQRYVVLAQLLGTPEQLEKYERKYSEAKVLEIYSNFLQTVQEYVGVEGQTELEQANAGALGATVSSRMAKLLGQKRIKKKLGKEETKELLAVVSSFNTSAEALPSLSDVEGQKPIKAEVVTAEQLEEMKKSGGEVSAPVIILPEKTEEKPYNVEEAMAEIIGEDMPVLDTPDKVRDFNREVKKAGKLEEKFLLHAHLTSQLTEHQMSSTMSEKWVLATHIATMNSAIEFARQDGQGMEALKHAVAVFGVAEAEVDRLLSYRRIKLEVKKKSSWPETEKNLKWLKNRAQELREKAAAYDKNKDRGVSPFPGSPAIENAQGAPSAAPVAVEIDSSNKRFALQATVFAQHGLSILEAPLETYKKMRGKKLNSFEKFVILENLSHKIMSDEKWMEGLTKAERFEMIQLLGHCLKATIRASDTPKDWPEGEGVNPGYFYLWGQSIYVSELISELVKAKGKRQLGAGQQHMDIPLDTPTFELLIESYREYDEQFRYQLKQKGRVIDAGPIPF